MYLCIKVKTMATIIIRYKDHTRIIRPSDSFDGSVSKLVEAITLSDYRKGIKTFKNYKVA